MSKDTKTLMEAQRQKTFDNVKDMDHVLADAITQIMSDQSDIMSVMSEIKSNQEKQNREILELTNALKGSDYNNGLIRDVAEMKKKQSSLILELDRIKTKFWAAGFIATAVASIVAFLVSNGDKLVK